MNTLVTGGAGFIGSHLVDRLLDEGHDVSIIDDFSEGKYSNLPINKKLTILKYSILNDIGNYFAGIDRVYHLAALTRPQFSMLHPIETNQVNVEGIINILKACVENRVPRVVFVSSSSIYGKQFTFPTTESAVPHPMSPYALTKLVGEQYCKLYQLLYRTKANYIRPFNVYGTRQRPDSEYAAAIPKFIDCLSKGTTPWITGDGKQARDYVYVDDVVDLIIKAGESKVYGEAFNAGSGKNISINDLFETIRKIMNKNVIPDHVAPVIEPNLTLADIGKAKTMLGWEPKVSLEEGLRRTICVK